MAGGEELDLLQLHRGIAPERPQHRPLLAELQPGERLDLQRVPEVERALERLHLLVGVDADADPPRQLGDRLLQPLVEVPGDGPQPVLQRSLPVVVQTEADPGAVHQGLHLLAIEAAKVEERVVGPAHRTAGLGHPRSQLGPVRVPLGAGGLRQLEQPRLHLLEHRVEPAHRLAEHTHRIGEDRPARRRRRSPARRRRGCPPASSDRCGPAARSAAPPWRGSRGGRSGRGGGRTGSCVPRPRPRCRSGVSGHRGRGSAPPDGRDPPAVDRRGSPAPPPRRRGGAPAGSPAWPAPR